MNRTYANQRVKRGGSRLALNECNCRFGEEKRGVVPHVRVGILLTLGLRSGCLQILSGRSSFLRSGEQAVVVAGVATATSCYKMICFFGLQSEWELFADHLTKC